MATMVLSSAGAVIGGALGGPMGAMIGQAVGAVGGAFIDQELFRQEHNIARGELGALQLQTAAEGASLPFVYGRVRLSGHVIWATRYEEVISEQKQGGKATDGSSTTTITSHSYFANFAVALCEGPITAIRRVWANGKELDLADIILRPYLGTQDQLPDPLIEAKQSTAPAYRGTAYVVFERLPLAEFGNRLPQLSFEVQRVLEPLENQIRAITLIPGAGEFVYQPTEVLKQNGPGDTQSENRHVAESPSDLVASLDELQALCANLERVALVVSWFGDDLRAGDCLIEPRVTPKEAAHLPQNWQVAGLTRSQAKAVSKVKERPAFGGTPSDASVLAAIQELKARGLEVMLYPFIMMDIPAGNAKPDPYGGQEQATYPWRGRIKTQGQATTNAEIESFLGGDTDWRYRRFILHYAELAKQAGGVDAFLIGTELRGLTQSGAGNGDYPFVGGLKTLAADVRAVLGASTKISYAADWSEYAAHKPQDDELRFPLDPLWADPNIDFIGIDNYLPLTDLRGGENNAETYGLQALRAGIASGEYYDWYYEDNEARQAGTRTPITDGSLGKPWVFRQKDLKNWWQNQHYERVGGQEMSSSTPWVPQSKPIWFTELGFPAVDKGTNQPNVFVDPKSAESSLPHFSSGATDELSQRRALEASLSYWGKDHPLWPMGDNPEASGYNGNMVSPSHIFAWTWDARPYPQFPSLTNLWSDGDNWHQGHWLTGRLGKTSATGLIRAIAQDFGHDETLIHLQELGETLDGYVVRGPTSFRAAVAPLLQLVQGMAADRGTHIEILPRYDTLSAPQATHLQLSDIAEPENAEDSAISIFRGDEQDLPGELRLRFYDPLADYEQQVVASRRLEQTPRNVADWNLPLTANTDHARRLTEKGLQALWLGRETLHVRASLKHLPLTVGDVIELPAALFEGETTPVTCQIEQIYAGSKLEIEATRLTGKPLTTSMNPTTPLKPINTGGQTVGPAVVKLLNLPQFREGQGSGPFIGLYNANWPQAYQVYQSSSGADFSPLMQIIEPAVMGFLKTQLSPGVLWRWDTRNSVEVELFGGQLQSKTALEVLGGANLCAIGSAGNWELLQFAEAELIDPLTYRLSNLLRGQLGTEAQNLLPKSQGTDFILLNSVLQELPWNDDLTDVTQHYQIVPSGKPIGYQWGTSLEFAGTMRSAVPYAPVHVQAEQTASGDLALSWKRRSRWNADGWAQVDVPQWEQTLAFTIDVYKAQENGPSQKVTTLNAEAEAASYSRAQMLLDLGSGQHTLELRIQQVSSRVGLGDPAAKRVSVVL